MTRPAPLVLGGLVALVTSLTAPAHADPKPEAKGVSDSETPDAKRARALELFDRSIVLYDSGRFRDAAALLEEAYAIFPEPVLLYNLARAYQESGELAKSIDAYERFLAADPDVKDRGGIEQRIVTLREQLRAAEHAKPDEASRPPGAVPAETAATAARPSGADEDRSAAKSASIVPWIVAGSGVVALGTGAVLGVVSSSRHESATKEPVGAKAETLQDQAESYALAANVTLIAGAVLTVVGATWGVIDLASSSSRADVARRATIAVGPGSARFTLAF